ncbi:hypothetical protein QBC34DRAFT_484523 [Podospora aff. communis PSN243]|uniref:Uncharacterized protein n=1 Tax=Podospora aff. communis PSN243 TaxID=3040156 RepID=A0AAV9GQP9_9PEZI|nr:hypothetical protein QBC34DRAFT_484523 [Podospora aff. communis PSN243]
MALRLTFVNLGNPTDGPSSETRKLAYSHAFRQAHAQRRREHVKKYQSERQRVPAQPIWIRPSQAVPSPVSQALSSTRDPFSCLPRPLSSIEYFLLHHYVHVIVPFTLGHCDLFDHAGDHKPQLLREWLGLAIRDDTLMVAAVLLSTCRHILRSQPGNPVFVQLALQYKQVSLQTLRREMSGDAATPVSSVTVARALALALDEIAIREHAVARRHLKGVIAIVNSGGGTTELGLAGLLERMYRKLVEAFGLEDLETDHHLVMEIC